jgi:hypothetical protein
MNRLIPAFDALLAQTSILGFLDFWVFLVFFFRTNGNFNDFGTSNLKTPEQPPKTVPPHKHGPWGFIVFPAVSRPLSLMGSLRFVCLCVSCCGICQSNIYVTEPPTHGKVGNFRAHSGWRGTR